MGCERNVLVSRRSSGIKKNLLSIFIAILLLSSFVRMLNVSTITFISPTPTDETTQKDTNEILDASQKMRTNERWDS